LGGAVFLRLAKTRAIKTTRSTMTSQSITVANVPWLAGRVEVFTRTVTQ
jgi:hypothetical protein